MLRLLWQIISLLVTKGTEIIQLKLLYISLNLSRKSCKNISLHKCLYRSQLKLTGCCFKLDGCIQLFFAGAEFPLFRGLGQAFITGFSLARL